MDNLQPEHSITFQALKIMTLKIMCSATWNYTLPLTNGHPSGSKVCTSDAVGTYDDN
jgi:hypothetical protein